MLQLLDDGQLEFREFFLQLIAYPDLRLKYLEVQYEQEYGAEFVVRTKELMRRFVSALNNLLPPCAIDQVIL